MSWLLRSKRALYKNRVKSPEAQRWLGAALPSAGRDFREVSFLALDLEMTGLDHQQHDMVSIGWVEINNGVVDLATANHLLIQVAGSVGQSAVIHQIRDSDLNQGATEQEAMEVLMAVSAGKVLVFHHADADMPFLNAAWQSCFNLPVLLPVVDTLALEKAYFTRTDKPIEQGALRLAACRSRYNLPAYPAHNALVDAISTAELLLAIAARKAHGDVCQLKSLLS